MLTESTGQLGEVRCRGLRALAPSILAPLYGTLPLETQYIPPNVEDQGGCLYKVAVSLDSLVKWMVVLRLQRAC